MSEAHDLNKDIKKYKLIYVALLVFTVITVAVSYIHLPFLWLTVTLALIIATFKAALVSSFFMHLLHEKPIILWSLGLTLFFVIAMIVLFIVSQYSVFEGLNYVTETVPHSVH